MKNQRNHNNQHNQRFKNLRLNQDSQDFKIAKIEHNPGNPLILKIMVQTTEDRRKNEKIIE